MANVETGLLGDGVPYIRGGAGEREAAVFFGASALFRRLDQAPAPGRYARQVSRLLPGYRFTIFGYAGSSFELIGQSIARAIGESRPDLVLGISLGGVVALRFAARYPDLVRRLVLLVSAQRFSAGGRRMMERQLVALERGDFPTLVRENALLFRRPWYNWLVRLKLWKEGSRLAAGYRDAAAILHDYRQLFGPDFELNAEYARRIVSPTLVLGGTADQYFDRAAFAETARLIPGAQIQLFERETHMLPIEQSGKVAGAIADFVGGQADEVQRFSRGRR